MKALHRQFLTLLLFVVVSVFAQEFESADGFVHPEVEQNEHSASEGQVTDEELQQNNNGEPVYYFDADSSASPEVESFVRSSKHTNNWAVLVSTSRFWFNYRHMANTLSMYRTVKRLGIPDSQIILMLADDVSCNPRNMFPGAVFNNKLRELDLYGDSIEVDYRGYEVTVENFIRLLTDRWDDNVPRSKRLLTDDKSNIFIYLTGHGGNEFLKFQDADEISAFDIADAFGQMWEKHRYNEILFMIDTCQANTMYSKFYSPNILAVGSSAFEENSYSHHADQDVGVAVIDRFTYYNLEFLEGIEKTSRTPITDLFATYEFDKIHSNPGVRTDLLERDVKEVLITDFFGNNQHVAVDNIEGDVLHLLRDSVANSTARDLEKQEAAEPVSAEPSRTLAQTAMKSAGGDSRAVTVLVLLVLLLVGSCYL